MAPSSDVYYCDFEVQRPNGNVFLLVFVRVLIISTPMWVKMKNGWGLIGNKTSMEMVRIVFGIVRRK